MVKDFHKTYKPVILLLCLQAVRQAYAADVSTTAVSGSASLTHAASSSTSTVPKSVERVSTMTPPSFLSSAAADVSSGALVPPSASTTLPQSLQDSLPPQAVPPSTTPFAIPLSAASSVARFPPPEAVPATCTTTTACSAASVARRQLVC